MLFVFFDDLPRFIGTASIYNNIFKIGIILIEYRKDGLLYITALVKGRRNNGDFRVVQKEYYLGAFLFIKFTTQLINQ